MKLGILINTDRHAADAVGIARAALARGHEVIIFAMDSGTRLLGDPAVVGLCRLKGVSMSFCDYNARGLDIAREGIPPEIVCGSQYNNAVMVHDADRVIVL
ncbi:MAG: DsrE family protein [Nitrospirota bacterium]